MATKAKTKANRTAERKSSRSQSASRNNQRRQASRNAFDVLEEDHHEVEEWFDEYDELKDSHEDRKADLAEKIRLALKIRAQIEEEIFYPQARKATGDNDLIDENTLLKRRAQPAELAPAHVPLASRRGQLRFWCDDPSYQRPSDAVAALQKVAQHCDKRLVGRRHRVVAEPGRAHPGEPLPFARRRNSRPFAADVKRHQQMEVGVGVGREGERREATRRDVDAEFLGELADQRRLRRFTRVDLAARKLPQPGHGLARRALGEQHPPVGVDQRHRRHEHDGEWALSCGSCALMSI